MTPLRQIAILGASGHIGKSLTACYLRQPEPLALHLFVRNREKMNAFLAGLPPAESQPRVAGFENFPGNDYDLVINCVGFGTPRALQENLAEIFRLTARFDDLVLDYLPGHPQTLYINLSSGAAYGLEFSQPVEENTPARFNLNHLQAEEFYGIAKLHSEAKHRALPRCNIVDLRIFAYFSRYIDRNDRSLLSEILSCLEEKRTLVTGPANLWRDYLHPQDLLSLIDCCRRHTPLNSAYDAFSAQEASKFEILDYFTANHGLRYEIDPAHQALSVTGEKKCYYPAGRKAESIGYRPAQTSLAGIGQEAAALLASLHRSRSLAANSSS